LAVDDRVTNSVDANGVSIGMTYDDLNRLLTRHYPDNGVEKYGYTADVSDPTSYTNQMTNVTIYAYDAMYRKTNEVTVGVTTNQYGYNGADDLLTVTDGNGHTTTWGYDAYGRVTNKVDAASTLAFAYKYDPDSRLTNRWSAAKGNTAYSYDAVGNLTKVTYPVSPAITLSYDALNRLTNMVDGVGTTVYDYDTAGQLLSEDGPWANDTVSYTYQSRLRTSLSVQAPNADAWSQSYGYDSARRLTSVSSPAGAFNYTYDPVELQRVDELSLPNGALITNRYDGNARLLSTVLKNSSGTALDSQSYVYNTASQRTNEMNIAGDSRDYTYDNAVELLTAFGKEPGGTTNRWQEQFGYRYDAAGNLNFRTNGSLIENFLVNNLNELTSNTNSGTLTVAGSTTSLATNVTVNTFNAVLYADATFASTNQSWASGANTYTAIAHDVYNRWSTNSVMVNLFSTNGYTYDSNGNLLSDGTRNFTYDDEDELIGAWVANAWSNNFAYDGRMRKRVETDWSWSGSSWVQTNEVLFVYDGNVVIQERDINNLPQVTYTRGNDFSGTLQAAGGIGGLLARTQNPQMLDPGTQPQANAYYHAGGDGNISILLSPSQMMVAKYLYDPYGNLLAMSGSLAGLNKYRFSSKEWNDNAGLSYYLYRVYDPNLQRWLSRDPIGDASSLIYRISVYEPPAEEGYFAVVDPAEAWNGLNLFAFLGDSPVNYDDPFGTRRQPGQSFLDCYKCCKSKVPGLDLSDQLGYWGIGSAAVGFVTGAIANKLSSAAANAAENAKLAGANYPGPMGPARLAAAQAGGAKAARLGILRGALRGVSKFSGWVGGIATAYSIGARGYCALSCRN
jgi:RHS repeat-associated protein